MNFGILKMSVEALKLNKMRSVLTTLGIIIGTAIVIIVLSVGAGIRALILNQLESITPEKLFVEVQVPIKATRTEKNFATAQSIAQGVQITTMKIRDMEQIEKLPNIIGSYGMTIAQEKFSYMNNEKIAMIFGTSPEYFEVENIKIAEGRFFTKEEDDSLAQVAVIGSEVKKDLYGNRPAVNKTIKVNNQSYRVVGVLQEIGAMWFMAVDDMIYIPVKTTQKKILGIEHLLMMGFEMQDPGKMNETIFQMEKILRKNHNIRDPANDDFAIRTQDEAMDIIDTVTGAITWLLLALALISLVVGGVGIMNVMYVSVTERTNEIGLKKAIGARPFAIKTEFLAESAIISAFGGLLGILFGIGISWLVSFVANSLDFEWPLVVQSWMIIIAFTIPVLTGIVFGYAPAEKAARLNPIEALRHV